MRRLPVWISLLFLTVSGFSQSLPEGNTLIERIGTANLIKVSDQVGDFTITDSDGNTWNLYQHLNAGKTVFIDLFFST
jgi:hypothetical protein